ncbi:MAG TPA: hypothetical protein PLL10_05140 [Elusimicrobiales bacterium]|nr:hypothetical protein [Elusimicrobiales bacterium]
MFSKQGFEDYFNQLYLVEKTMAEAVRQVLLHLHDEQAISRLKAILADEERHAVMVDHVRRLFK